MYNIHCMYVKCYISEGYLFANSLIHHTHLLPQQTPPHTLTPPINSVLLVYLFVFKHVLLPKKKHKMPKMADFLPYFPSGGGWGGGKLGQSLRLGKMPPCPSPLGAARGVNYINAIMKAVIYINPAT